jgi:hypothetical protein
LIKGQLEQFGPRALIREAHPDERYLDIYTAYSTDLNVAFKEIGAAAWERRRINEEGDKATLLSNNDLDEESKWLEFSVCNMIGRSAFRPSDLQVLSHSEIEEFQACDETYQATALIHILRRVQQLPRSDLRVQEHVKRILRCASKIKPTDGLSPWVMLTTPLFTAGCEALGSDRDVVRRLLHEMFELLRIRNIERALEILEMNWAQNLDNDDNDWETLLSKYLLTRTSLYFAISNLREGHTDWDFIPY